MDVRFPSALLVLVSLAGVPIPAGAASLADCGLEYVQPPPYSSTDPVVLTFRGLVDYCSGIRVAAAGERAALGLPPGPVESYRDFSVILAVQPGTLPPGTSCPAVEVPFEISARLPDLLSVISHVPMGDFIGVFLRREDEDGKLITLTDCGGISRFRPEGEYRTELWFRSGFYANVFWKRGTQGGQGFAVPADPVWTDSGLFWFFDPKNTEIMVKVLDGCAVNGHYWVLGSASTDVEFTLWVTNWKSNDTWSHTSPGGKLAPAFADVNAFPCTGD